MLKNKKILAVLIVIIILLIDQVSKIWVKTSMNLGEGVTVFSDWFVLTFVENPGMAFGMELPFLSPETAKIVLTVFRIIAVFGIGWYIKKLIEKGAPKGVVFGMSAVLAGALGNIIDSVFFGAIFTESDYKTVATFATGDATGYAPYLQGKVVDMLHFPLFSGKFPEWFPIWKGESFLFFRPVFNIADTAISLGVAYLILFQFSFFRKL